MKKAVSLTLIACTLGMSLPAKAQLITHKDLSYATVKGIVDGAMDACLAKGWHVSITVVGRTGEILAQVRGDDAPPNTMESSWRKAYTALTTRAPSSVFAEEVAKDANAQQRAMLSGMLGNAGGLPIKVGDDVIGGVGVTGLPGNQAPICAQAGIDRVAAQLR